MYLYFTLTHSLYINITILYLYARALVEEKIIVFPLCSRYMLYDILCLLFLTLIRCISYNCVTY